MAEFVYTLLYMHRGKLNVEEVTQWRAMNRSKALQGCCATIIYRTLKGDATLHEFRNSCYWTTNYSKPVPDEVKLAAMLVN